MIHPISATNDRFSIYRCQSSESSCSPNASILKASKTILCTESLKKLESSGFPVLVLLAFCLIWHIVTAYPELLHRHTKGKSLAINTFESNASIFHTISAQMSRIK
ncbi:hypothetical protein AQUCO_05200022v1 [Aquilegia coerulea]|uniref:Uncharacterized protein n=1 Tax=Aquilegia coerulea TaxID=218851 RepID=A0A2G5CIK9_AQUCA|nr:hypothetical protein AQUCO_05200022v1 [Aquilegia coerulea]